MSKNKKEIKVSGIVSLADARKKKQAVTAQSYKDVETRLADLEQDMMRLIDFALEMEGRLDGQGKFIHKILNLVKKM